MQTDNTIANDTPVGLLNAVVPSSGVKYVAEWKPKSDHPNGGVMIHHVCDSHDEMQAKCLEISAKGHNAYYAMASYKEVKYAKKGDFEYVVGRTQDNVYHVKSLWMDWDVGKKSPDSYATRDDAIASLKLYLKATGLHAPIVISSGHGIHTYWVFDQEVTVAEWEPIAEKQRRVMRHLEVKFDPSRDKDCASVLRPIGTQNYKAGEPPRPVKVVRGKITALPAREYERLLDAYIEENGLSVPTNANASSSPSINSDLIVPAEYPPSDPVRVAESCKQIAAFRETGGESEPIWHVSVGLLKHCADGEQFAHEWSAKHKEYDREATQSKMDRWSFGPTTCEKFREINPKGCDGCTHAVTSPIQLGVESNTIATIHTNATVARFNSKHFVAPAGSSVYVYVEADGKSPQPMQKAAFFDLYANDYSSVDDKQQNSAIYWFKNKYRRQFLGGVTFDPSMKAGADKYNLFSGYAVTPSPGDCEPILSHIHNVLCAGNAEHADFVLNWGAQMFQRPEVQPVTALVFLSGEGTGKTIVTDLFQNMLGRYWYKASSTAALVTQFNSFLQDCILVVGEEAVWGGDAGKAGTLRDLITTKQLRIEIKNGPTYSAESFLHFIFLANDQWAVPAGHDARRWAVFRVSECKKGDSAYFAKLAAWASDKRNQSAFLHYLLSRDISKFNSRHAPMTEGLLQQKLLSLCDIGQFLYHSLMRGSLSDHSMEWPETVVCSDFVEGIAKTVANKHDIKRLETRAGILLKEIFQDGLRKGRETQNRSRRYVWHFPPLDTARAAFARWMAQPIAWDAE